MTLDRTITRFQLGDFRRFHVYLGDDDGNEGTAFVGGFDTMTEAHAHLDDVEERAYGEALHLYFYVHDTDNDTTLEQGYLT
jgi:hypothetical protein